MATSYEASPIATVGVGAAASLEPGQRVVLDAGISGVVLHAEGGWNGFGNLAIMGPRSADPSNVGLTTMDDHRTTPFGMWRYGNDFRQAAIAVLMEHNDRAFMPYYFLLGQSVELSLKAFLMGRGLSLQELRSRKYGHDLKALLDESRRRRLGLEVAMQPVHCGVIQLLGIEYLARRFQYIRTGMMTLPDARFAQEAADLLSEHLKDYCYRVTKWDD